MTKYDKLLLAVATEHNTTVAEVEKEIQNAIKCTELDIPPALFIALCTAAVRKSK